MSISYIGWDIGGAHVKAAVINQGGDISAIYQRACPLWKGMDQLHKTVSDVLQDLPDGDYRHSVTMTGELVDLFNSRNEGVKQIITTMQDLLIGNPLLIFAGPEGLLPVEQLAEQHYSLIASANWLASATFAAQQVENGLFIDIGSTTTDILALKRGQVSAQGFTDYERLVSQELVYTGIVRSAVMSVVQSVNFEDKETGIMAEYFATMADVYRVTGELNEAHDQTDSADGAEKTPSASARRLARMIGCDFYPEQFSRWYKFAVVIRDQQLQKIRRSCQRLLATHKLPQNTVWIGAGIGRFLAKQIAQDLNYPYQDFSGLCHQNTQQNCITAADCAPAVAVARLRLTF